MCDISKKTKFKTKTVYKAVINIMGVYYSYFTYKKLSVGKVEPLTKKELDNNRDVDFVNKANAFSYFSEDGFFYNYYMIGKVSGFSDEDDAWILARSPSQAVVLKVVLGGNIMEGTARRIHGSILSHHKTYAGTEILSMEEITK